MKEFWNQRYQSKTYVYGTLPNLFFKEQLDKLHPGRLLLPAEGEGRNAVYAAQQGWQVTAIDISEAGRDKALKLARTAGVEIEYYIGNFGEIELPTAFFDCVGLIFAHFPADKRIAFHQKAVQYLKPGGILMLEGFSKEQMSYQSGGPKNEAMLFSVAELKKEFAALTDLEATQKLLELKEGIFHEGTASVVRLVGKKGDSTMKQFNNVTT